MRSTTNSLSSSSKVRRCLNRCGSASSWRFCRRSSYGWLSSTLFWKSRRSGRHPSHSGTLGGRTSWRSYQKRPYHNWHTPGRSSQCMSQRPISPKKCGHLRVSPATCPRGSPSGNSGSLRRTFSRIRATRNRCGRNGASLSRSSLGYRRFANR